MRPRCCSPCEEEMIQARRSFSRYSVREVVVPYGTFGPDCDTGRGERGIPGAMAGASRQTAGDLTGADPSQERDDILIEAYARDAGQG